MNNGRRYRSRQRGFTGCWTCRSRKVKCDEAAPVCQTCCKSRLECSGYPSRFVWVDSDNQSWPPHGRRSLRAGKQQNCSLIPSITLILSHADQTWKGHYILSNETIHDLLVACDEVQITNHSDHEVRNMPFTVWQPNGDSTHNTLSLVPSPLFRQPLIRVHADDIDSQLFAYYLDHIAALMMPFKDYRNPWKTLYPALAIQQQSCGQKILIKAMMSQAAFNLAHRGHETSRMLCLGNKYYRASVEGMRNWAMKPTESGEFIATVLTMMMAEVYNGQNDNWRVHFQGAWNYLLERCGHESLADIKIAFEILQSLVVIQLVQETSQVEQTEMVQIRNADHAKDTSIVTWLSSISAFGFTIGASNSILYCIHRITRLKPLSQDRSINLDKEANDILQMLSKDDALGIVENWQTLSKDKQIIQFHLRAFRSAACIYLYRSSFDLPPWAVESYVSEVFQSVNYFYQLGGGSLSLWPAFIAAIEAYTDTHMKMAKDWLAISTNVGIGNRYKIRAVVEQVWQIRKDISSKTSQDQGTIAVDWRVIMQNLGLDILLV